MTSQSRSIRSHTQIIVKFVKFWPLIFWIVRVRVIRQMFQLQFMIEKWMPDLLTPSTTFYDVSVLWNLFSKAGMRQFGASGSQRICDCCNRPVNDKFKSEIARIEQITSDLNKDSERLKKEFDAFWKPNHEVEQFSATQLREKINFFKGRLDDGIQVGVGKLTILGFVEMKSLLLPAYFLIIWWSKN